jgi:hypothetical protein
MADVPKQPRTAAATKEHLRRSARRAVDDPAQLARAARIVRAALERQRLSLADLVPDGPDDPKNAA